METTMQQTQQDAEIEAAFRLTKNVIERSLSGFLKIPVVFEKIEVRQSGTKKSRRVYEIRTGNLHSYIGAFAAILKTCTLQATSLSTMIVAPEVADRFEGFAETGDTLVWMGFNLRYTHNDGGSNGATVASAWLNIDALQWQVTFND